LICCSHCPISFVILGKVSLSIQRKGLINHNTWRVTHDVPGSCLSSGMPRWGSKYFPSFECAKIPPSLFFPYDPSDFLLLKHLWTHICFFLTLRAEFFSSSYNISAVAANWLLENEWACIFDGNYRRSPITCCSGRWLNKTDSLNAGHSDGTKLEWKRDT
jgi:hypothetical protein